MLWKFGDHPGEFPVRVSKLVPDERIELGWDAQEGGYQTGVVMTFEPLPGGVTLVRVVEGGCRENSAGLRSSCLDCYGWTQMLCCLKARLEYGINLRRGFFQQFQALRLPCARCRFRRPPFDYGLS